MHVLLSINNDKVTQVQQSESSYEEKPNVLDRRNGRNRGLTSPAMGVESLFTLLMIPGLILLTRLKKEQERKCVRERGG